MVVVPYVRGLSEQFRRLAAIHSFRTAFKPGKKMKELKTRAQEPLGEKQKSVLYEISCKCKNAVYVGETSRLFKVRKKEHKSKVRLTNEDIKNGRLMTAKERMGKEDGGLARHSVDCAKGIDCENTRILGNENRLRQRKVREWTESLRAIHSRKKVHVLNSFESLMPWRPLLDKYFDKENVKDTRARAVSLNLARVE